MTTKTTTDKIQNEPVLTATGALVVAILGLLKASGIDITGDQIEALLAVVAAAAVFAPLVRSKVTPSRNACKCPPATKARRRAAVKVIKPKPATRKRAVSRPVAGKERKTDAR